MDQIINLCQRLNLNCCRTQPDTAANKSFEESLAEQQAIQKRDSLGKIQLRNGQQANDQGSVKVGSLQKIVSSRLSPAKRQQRQNPRANERESPSQEVSKKQKNFKREDEGCPDQKLPQNNTSEQPKSLPNGNQSRFDVQDAQNGLVGIDSQSKVNQLRSQQPVLNVDRKREINARNASLTPESSHRSSEENKSAQSEKGMLLELPEQQEQDQSSPENANFNDPETYQEWKQYLSLINLQLEIIFDRRRPH